MAFESTMRTACGATRQPRGGCMRRPRLLSAIGALSAGLSAAICLSCGINMTIKSLEPNSGTSAEDAGLNPDEYWDLCKETVASPDRPPFQLRHLATFFKNDLPPGGFSYVYGGKTASVIQKGTSREYPGIFACYLDNEDYSGVTIVFGQDKKINLEPLRSKEAAGMAFWAKAGAGVASVYLGILDNGPDGKKVQSRISLRDAGGALDTAWRYFMIPLKRFPSKGKYWDASRKMEVTSDIDWKAVNEVRFSTNKGENRVADRLHRVTLYIEHLSIIEEIPGYTDPDKKWAAWTSQAPDLVLHDFETAPDREWTTAAGPASQVRHEIVPTSEPGCGRRALAIAYHVVDWCDVMYDYRSNRIPLAKRDWTHHRGIKFMLCSESAYQPLNLQISDAGGELFIAPCGGPRGWSEVVVPFRDFYKFPYYQPPEAVQNGVFDLDSAVKIDIKPAGEGTSGRFLVDNIALTNARGPTKSAPPLETAAIVSGSFGAIEVNRINDGIFGINAQHWDGDLLLPGTAGHVKAVGHRVVRFPGGLSADDYHWRKSLSSKDQDVDTDEFIDFCRATGCEPMLTVNFGTGTPEEAADWVGYVNITKKAGVRYWEVGNELYGDWHKNHCAAGAYGRRCAEFIAAMKRADPSILVSVVWKIEGEWNRTVFEFTKEIADGVSVHNYPQEFGQENDCALLSAPQGLAGIVAGLRAQLATCGTPGKKYQIWLSEWNSVNFNPGPQSLGIVNALFVADYLGMLAKLGVDQASYWNIHNGVFERGGDYGYLTRSDVPEGPNVPRLSYWAFKLASESLRGAMARCASSDIDLSAYATLRSDGTKCLFLVNKHPQTRCRTTIGLKGFAGSGTMSRLTGLSGKNGYSAAPVTITAGMELDLPAYSVTALTVKPAAVAKSVDGLN